MADAAAGPRLHTPCMGTQVRLSHIEVEGFKSFRDKTVIGPLGDFTCIVGPNGCGKSVVGEAIAFALGGNRKILRAGSLSGLLNQERRATGGRTAQVTLRLELVHQDAYIHQHPVTEAVSPSTSTTAAAAAAYPASMFSPNATPQLFANDRLQDRRQAQLLHQGTAAAAAAGYQLAVEEQHQSAEQQWLGVRRTLRGENSKTHIKRPDSEEWVQVNQAELQAELATYNIHTQVVDRYVVTQSRQAVDVGDPVGLVKYLEFLTSTGDYEARIQQHGSEIEQLAGNIDETQQQIARLDCTREQLAPHVTHLQSVQQQQSQLLHSKVQLLQDQQEHCSKLLQQQQHQVATAEAAAAETASDLALLKSKQAALQEQEADIMRQLQAKAQEEQRLKKKVSRLLAAVASSKVQVSCSATALETQRTLAEKLQDKLAKHQVEEAQHKQQVAEIHLQLRHLQEQKSETEHQLATVQQAVADGQQQLRRSQSCTGAEHAGVAKPTRQSAGVSRQVRTLQQQLAAAEAEVAELQLVKSIATDRATCAATSVQEYQLNAAKAAASVEASRQQMHQASTAVETALAAIEAGQIVMCQAEQQWKEALLKERELQEQLQQAQAQQLQLQQDPNHVHQPQHRPGCPGAWPAYDTAVQQLKQKSDAQQLPGAFFGRLCNLLSISDASAAVAVNTAIAEVANLNTTLVVSDRQTASAVVDHFRQNKIGTIQCKILSEMSATSSTVYTKCSSGGSSKSSRPLLEFVTAVQGVQRLQTLLQQLLGNWLLVENRDTASVLLHQRQNIVTRVGEVFKADGEVVVDLGSRRANSSNMGSSGSVYGLQVGQPHAIPPLAGVASAAAGDASAARKAAAAAAREAQQQVFTLQQQAAVANRAAAATKAGLQAARDACCKHRQQLAAGERYEQLMRSQCQAEEAKAAHLLPQFQQQIETAQQELQAAASAAEAAATAVVNAAHNQQQLKQQLQQQIEACGGSSSSNSDTAATAAACNNTAAAQLAEKACAEAAAAVAAAWAQADKLKGLQKRAGVKAAAVAKELVKLQATDNKQQELARLQAQLEAALQQLATARSALEAISAQQAELTGCLKPIQKDLAAVSRAAAAAQQDADSRKALLQQRLAALNDLKLQLDQYSAARQQLQKQQQMHQAMQTREETIAAMTAAGAATEHGNHALDAEKAETANLVAPKQHAEVQQSCEAQGVQHLQGGEAKQVCRRHGRGSKQAVKRKQKQHMHPRKEEKGIMTTGRRMIMDSSSSSSSDDASRADGQGSSSDSDSCVKDNKHSSRTRDKTTTASAAMHKKSHHHQQPNEPVLPSAAVLAKQGQQLQLRQQQLEDLEHLLQQQVAKVNETALEEDLLALQSLATAHAALQNLEKQRDAAAQVQEQLWDERYNKLLQVLQSLNSNLDEIYKTLTGGCGSAYCAYTQERRLLFSQGATLHIQPDGVAWRQFSMLSGGQQALAALALSFALQALFPSPFYFFDEVDCALDSLAAGRVAFYVTAQCQQNSTKALHSSSSSDGAATTRRPAAAAGTGSSHDSSNTAAGGMRCAQYLLVSHRPAVFESASCLLGGVQQWAGQQCSCCGTLLTPAGVLQNNQVMLVLGSESIQSHTKQVMATQLVGNAPKGFVGNMTYDTESNTPGSCQSLAARHGSRGQQTLGKLTFRRRACAEQVEGSRFTAMDC